MENIGSFSIQQLHHNIVDLQRATTSIPIIESYYRGLSLDIDKQTMDNYQAIKITFPQYPSSLGHSSRL